MQQKRDIFWNTVVQVLVRVVGLAIAIITTKLTTRYLGTSGVGELNTVTTYLGFFVVFADLGLFSTAVREISRQPEREDEILTATLWLRLTSSLIATALALGAAFFMPYSDGIVHAIVISCSFILFNLISSIFDIILQVRLTMQRSALAELVSKLLSLAFLWVAISSDAGSNAIFIITIPLTALLICISKWIASRGLVPLGRAKARMDLVTQLFLATLPLGAVYILNNILFKVDSQLLYIFKGESEVGIYTIAYRVLEVTLFVGSYFASALKPSLSRNVTDNPAEAAALVRTGSRVMLFLSAPIAIVSLLFPQQIILFLSDQSFVAGAGALAILGFVLVPIYLDMLLGEVLIAADKRRTLTIIAVCMVVLNITLNLIFIPRYSYIAAAATTLATELILFTVNSIVVARILPGASIDPRAFFGVVLASLVTVGLSWPLRTSSLSIVLIAVICFAVYGAASVLFKVIDPREIRSLMTRAR